MRFTVIAFLMSFVMLVHASHVSFQGVYDVDGNCKQSSAWVNLGFNNQISIDKMKSCLEGKGWDCDKESSGIGLFCYHRFRFGSCEGTKSTIKSQMSQCTNGDYLVNSAQCGSKQCYPQLGNCMC